MRKAVWGAIALGVFAFHFGSPLRELSALRPLASVALIAGYLLLSLDPPSPTRQQRNFLIAGILASLASFLITISGAPMPLLVLARALAVASVALPLWLIAGPVRYGFVAAAAVALVTGLTAVSNAGLYATSIHAYMTAASAWLVATAIYNPSLLTRKERKPPRLVVASNIVRWTPKQKADALAILERRFQQGEMPEHVYLDKRQEIESR